MKINYVQVEFEPEGDIYEYKTTDLIVPGDFVIVKTPDAEIKSVKVLAVPASPKYKGALKFCMKDRLFEMELEADFNKT